MSARRHLLNAVPNVLWTSLFGLPVYVYSARWLSRGAILGFCLASAAVLFLPARALRPLELSGKLSTYQRLHVPLLLRLTQDATWLQRWNPARELLVRPDERSIRRALSDTRPREQFHAALLLFFGLCNLWALAHQQWGWSAFMLLANVLYNLYPVWLQQYLRLRLTRLQTRKVIR